MADPTSKAPAPDTGSDAVRGSLGQNTIFHLLTQPQALIRAYLCDNGYCESGVPVKLPHSK